MKRYSEEKINDHVEKVNKTLRMRLKELRKKENYKQVDVAVALHMDRSTYTRLENGIAMGLFQLVQLAAFFHTDISYLIGESDER